MGLSRLCEIINRSLNRRIKNLETEVKSQAEYIKLLILCDDSSTKVIVKMDGEIEQLENEVRILKQSCKAHEEIAKQRLDRFHNLEAVIECQKETIEHQGIGNEEKHNILCSIKEAVNEYFGD